jgi:hypothetical protein
MNSDQISWSIDAKLVSKPAVLETVLDSLQRQYDDTQECGLILYNQDRNTYTKRYTNHLNILY